MKTKENNLKIATKKILNYATVAGLLTLSVHSLAQNAPALRIGMELAYPPFEMTDTQGNPSGISVDFANELGKYLGREVIIENISWDGLIPALRTKRLDLVISSMTITEERAKSVDFSVPYARSSLGLLVNKKSNIKTVNDLNQKGKTVAVKKGTTGHTFARVHLPNASILVFDKENTAELEVAQGKADAFIYDQFSVYRAWEKHQATTVPLLAPLETTNQDWGVAMTKGSELKPKVDAFIVEFKKNGGFDVLTQKYLGNEKKIFDEQKIPFFF